VLAGQLNAHRREMNAAILGHSGTVMQYVGDAVMAVFGAPFARPDHALAACRAASAMHARQASLDRSWAGDGLEPFGLGIGVCSGPVAAALLGSEERLEYTLVGDTVNLAQRLGDLARPAGMTVISDATAAALRGQREFDVWEMPARTVKGRTTPVRPFELRPPDPAAGSGGPSFPGPNATDFEGWVECASQVRVPVGDSLPVGAVKTPAGRAAGSGEGVSGRGRRWWPARGRGGVQTR
jgi:class 3 adenylate cyclase